MTDFPRARFTVRHVGPVIVLEDLCEQRKSASITNDAENVVRYLHAAEISGPDSRVIYRDTEGRYDELVHDGRGGFVGFLPRGASLEEALSVLERIDTEIQ